VRFTDERKYFVSEASVYRLLKAHDLITSPAYVVIKAANEFKDKTTAINQLWQTDFTYLKITGWGWYFLSTVLDDFSRYIVAWKLCATMCAEDVTATLDLALLASGLNHATVVHRPRLLSDNGSPYVAGDLARWLENKGIEHVRGAPYHPQTQGKIERWHQTLKNRILLNNYYLPEDLHGQKIEISFLKCAISRIKLILLPLRSPLRSAYRGMSGTGRFLDARLDRKGEY
jgi:putative transposase